jgi:CheY-like chemotaxis protein
MYITLLDFINEQNKFDLLLLDLEYLTKPVVIKILKQLKEFKGISVLVMQNSTSDFSDINYYENVQNIIKPVKKSVLQNFLDKKKKPKTETNKTKNTDAIKILVVEDNKINMLLTKTLLQNHFPKCIILEASNGLEALETAKKETPEIILMDIQMPIMNGYEATIAIKKILPRTKIIALTAGIIDGEKEKCLDIGMNDFIVKPIDKIIFEESIIKWVNSVSD